MIHLSGQPGDSPPNPRMQEYLRREVPIALEHMIVNRAAFHVFDMDKEGKYVFLMAAIPRESISQFEQYLNPSEAPRAATPVRHETNKTEE